MAVLQLILVSLIWAFSFGLIKKHLAGLDPAFVAGVRLALSALLFLPFLRLKGVGSRIAVHFFLLGAVQFGLMYVAYLASFGYLQSSQVALLTVFTPIWVTLFEDLRQHRFSGRGLAAALLAVAGAAVALYERGSLSRSLAGFALVQASNLCFAVGQVFYRAIMKRKPEIEERRIFGLSYLGALAAVLLFWAAKGASGVFTLNIEQILTLLYLGIFASGIGFFLWNRGALGVGAGTLAAMNNLKIPLAIAASLLVFGEPADPLRLACGGGLILLALAVGKIRA